MPNDVLMFQKSRYSIAMGQASDEVKKSATYVTGGMDEEGFAKGVDEFVLKRADEDLRLLMGPRAGSRQRSTSPPHRPVGPPPPLSCAFRHETDENERHAP